MKPLTDHIADAQQALENVDGVIDRVALPSELTAHLRALTDLRGNLNQASALVSARGAAMAAMSAVDSRVDAGGMVNLWDVPVPFADARMILVQAYLSTSWSLVDMLTAIAGRFVCIEAVGKKTVKPAKLWEHFVKDGKSVQTDLSGILSHGYGLPVAVSYALRNHFVHDGAQYDDRTFFETPGVSFEVSGDGWRFVERKVFNEYRVESTDTLAPETWPWPKDDIRKIFAICEREIDAAMGLVLTHAASGFKLQVGHLLDGR